MGLASDFKKFLQARFTQCLAADLPQTSCVVIDVMVQLHAFRARLESDAPSGQQLVDQIFWKIFQYEHAALCFDHSASTPWNKAIEWTKRAERRKRPEPEQDATQNQAQTPAVLTPEDLEQALELDLVPYPFESVLSRRTLRTRICQYIHDGVIERMRLGGPNSSLQSISFWGTREVPSKAAWTPLGVVEETHHPERAGRFLGEADISCMVAANVFRAAGYRGVTILTVDTDLVAVALLHAFPGLFVALAYQRTMMSVDISRLASALVATYRVPLPDAVLVMLSKKTDYTPQTLQKLADWDVVMQTCCASIRQRGAPIVGRDTLDIGSFHKAMTSAISSGRKGITLNYKPGDHHLLRLAWVMSYYMRAPKLEVSDMHLPDKWGWEQREGSVSALDGPCVALKSGLVKF